MTQGAPHAPCARPATDGARPTRRRTLSIPSRRSMPHRPRTTPRRRTRTRPATRAPLLLAAALLGCGGAGDAPPAGETADAADSPPAGRAAALPAPQEAFWAALQAECGRAYPGRLAAGAPGDSAFARAELVMHVRACSADTVRIPFHAGDDRSRTWVLTRTAGGLRLKHDHRHEDGSEDAITQYGGDTRDAGSATRQSFHADSLTAALIPAARTNVWTFELVPGERAAYALRRTGTDRHFRVEFDLARPIDAPPAPWGAAP